MLVTYLTKKNQEIAERLQVSPIFETAIFRTEVDLKLWLRINAPNLAQYTVE